MGVGFDRYIKAKHRRPAKVMKDGTAVIATNTTKGPGQVRCLRCHGMCGPAKTPTGKSVMQCQSCGFQFSGTKF